MATHSSILAWEIPWREEPGGLHSPWGRRESDTTVSLTHTFTLTFDTVIVILHNKGSSFMREAME